MIFSKNKLSTILTILYMLQLTYEESIKPNEATLKQTRKFRNSEYSIVDSFNISENMTLLRRYEPINKDKCIKIYLEDEGDTQQTSENDSSADAKQEPTSTINSDMQENPENQQASESDESETLAEPESTESPKSQKASFCLEYVDHTQEFEFGEVVSSGNEISFSAADLTPSNTEIQTHFQMFESSKIVIQKNIYTRIKLEDDLYDLEFTILKNDCLIMFTFVTEEKPDIQISVDSENRLFYLDYFNFPANRSKKRFFMDITERFGFFGTNDTLYQSEKYFDTSKPKYLNIFCPFWKSQLNPTTSIKLQIKLLSLLPLYYGNIFCFLENPGSKITNNASMILFNRYC